MSNPWKRRQINKQSRDVALNKYTIGNGMHNCVCTYTNVRMIRNAAFMFKDTWGRNKQWKHLSHQHRRWLAKIKTQTCSDFVFAVTLVQALRFQWSVLVLVFWLFCLWAPWGSDSPQVKRLSESCPWSPLINKDVMHFIGDYELLPNVRCWSYFLSQTTSCLELRVVVELTS